MRTLTGCTADKAAFAMNCTGNGEKKTKAQSPTCTLLIHPGNTFYIAHWTTSPHQTPHCQPCRDHFFAPNRTLPYGEKG